jgi:hypothetical protein
VLTHAYIAPLLIRNLKKGAKLPIKEGLNDQLHKVCMEHWNLVDQQTKSNESKKKGKRKKDTKAKGKKRRRTRYELLHLSAHNYNALCPPNLHCSGDAEVEAFLASELGGKASGDSDSGDSDNDSEAETDGRRNSTVLPHDQWLAIRALMRLSSLTRRHQRVLCSAKGRRHRGQRREEGSCGEHTQRRGRLER